MAIQEDAEKIVALQEQISAEEKQLQLANPEFFARVKAVEEAKKNVDTLWDALKQKLVETEDYDVHEIKAGPYICKFSLSKTVKIGVEDIDKVPEEYVDTVKVADEKKLKAAFALYGEIPEGCVDKSFVRLVKSIKLENTLGEANGK